MKTDTLHLILKAKWFDMIASGKKKEEYREIKTYWEKRLGMGPHPFDDTWVWYSLYLKFVTFHKGYTNTTMTFKIKDIVSGYGNPQWGAPADREVFIIKLKERL